MHYGDISAMHAQCFKNLYSKSFEKSLNFWFVFVIYFLHNCHDRSLCIRSRTEGKKSKVREQQHQQQQQQHQQQQQQNVFKYSDQMFF